MISDYQAFALHGVASSFRRLADRNHRITGYWKLRIDFGTGLIEHTIRNKRTLTLLLQSIYTLHAGPVEWLGKNSAKESLWPRR